MHWLDAPVSGGSEGALKGTLSIMVGGADEDVERARPILGAMGSSMTHVGDVGAGQWAKAINQVILAGTYLGVAEGIALGLTAGLDMDKVVAALSGGAAGSWILTNRSGRMIDDDYPLGFKISAYTAKTSNCAGAGAPDRCPVASRLARGGVRG